MAWGGHPLSLDWFDLGRQRELDVIGIEDWMGLQYMYGLRYTWGGFQLMGFQAAIFRSGGRGQQSIIAWITPSDATNLVFKTTSALGQGVKHFFYWTYGGRRPPAPRTTGPICVASTTGSCASRASWRARSTSSPRRDP
jgi:hypothetical protein